MSTNKVCDVCGDATKPVMVVTLAINVAGAVAGSPATGCAHEVEACEGCWPKAMEDLSANVKEQLLRDIPRHRQVYAVNDEIAVLIASQRSAVAARDELSPDAKSYKTAAAEVERLSAAIVEKERQRAAIIAE